MFLGHTPVLHIVDEEKKFSTPSFLPNVRTDVIWSTFFKFWSTIYTGPSNRLTVDQGSALEKSTVFASIVAEANVELDTNGIETYR